jgi:glycosyltransferase involved in cell wall biosynthesis
MGRLKVLEVIPNFGSGGAERVVAHLLRGLDRARFEVEALSFFDEMDPILARETERAGTIVRSLGKRLGPDPRIPIRIGRELARFQPDVVHTHRYALAYCYLPLRWRPPPAAVHTIHNLASREVGSVGRSVHKSAFKHGVVPISIAREVSDTFAAEYQLPRPRLIPNGIQVDHFRCSSKERALWRAAENYPEKDLLVVSVGRLDPQKNPLRLLDVFERAFPEPTTRLLLIGEGGLRPEIEARIVERGLGERVRLFGMREDVREILGAADLYLSVSDWEGNPLSIMEAMAAGLAVVATSVGGVPELIEAGVSGLLAPPEDLGALVSSLRETQRPERRRELGSQAVLRAERLFGVDRMVHHYEDLFESLVKASTSNRARVGGARNA